MLNIVWNVIIISVILLSRIFAFAPHFVLLDTRGFLVAYNSNSHKLIGLV
jgi:hypothetical protein